MHQNDSDVNADAEGADVEVHAARTVVRRRGARPIVRGLRWAFVVLSSGSACGWADSVPTAAMLKPVHELVHFMSRLPATHPAVFAPRGLCIIENFAPFLFCGADAAARWESGFRAHAREEDLSGLATRFDTAYDFSEAKNRAYFSMPTTWTGRTHGRTFEEHGAWSFVLTREADGWRILGYGWGVTGYREAGN
jgi:hypothetical protein